MTSHRTAKIVAAAAVVVGVFVGTTLPAQAADTGWNGTRVATTDDVVKGKGKIK
jgi:hypothetical protein